VALEADLSEHLAEAAFRLLAPAVFLEERPADVVVDRPVRPAPREPILLPAEAAGLELRDDLAALLAPAGDDVQRPAERVAPEGRGRSADQLDALGLVEREQVEVHLFDRRFV